jgi:hypothetical protein
MTEKIQIVNVKPQTEVEKAKSAIDALQSEGTALDLEHRAKTARKIEAENALRIIDTELSDGKAARQTALANGDSKSLAVIDKKIDGLNQRRIDLIDTISGCAARLGEIEQRRIDLRYDLDLARDNLYNEQFLEAADKWNAFIRENISLIDGIFKAAQRAHRLEFMNNFPDKFTIFENGKALTLWTRERGVISNNSIID